MSRSDLEQAEGLLKRTLAINNVFSIQLRQFRAEAHQTCAAATVAA